MKNMVFSLVNEFIFIVLYKPSLKGTGALKLVIGTLIVSERVFAQNLFTLIELIANFFPDILASKSKQIPAK